MNNLRNKYTSSYLQSLDKIMLTNEVVGLMHSDCLILFELAPFFYRKCGHLKERFIKIMKGLQSISKISRQ